MTGTGEVSMKSGAEAGLPFERMVRSALLHPSPVFLVVPLVLAARMGGSAEGLSAAARRTVEGESVDC